MRSYEEKGRLMWDREGMSNEKTVIDYVHWDDFYHSPERNWSDVERRGWVARRIGLTKKEGRDRFGAKFSEGPHDDEQPDIGDDFPEAKGRQ